MTALRIETTPIDGLLVVHLDVHGDARGWFKEHWQRAKMTALGLPDFRPVQQNVSFNAAPGTTRGLHAEPWDKYVSVAGGRAFGAWVDLREGEGFGRSFTTELNETIAVFVPRGVANGFQTLDANTHYLYLVTDHWSPAAEYSFVNLADPTVRIPWPIDLDRAILSDKDRAHPLLSAATPVPPRATVVLGASGQLGRALRSQLGDSPSVRFLSREDLDLSVSGSVGAFDWSGVGTVINAAAFTAVDDAETTDGRRDAWQVNATSVRDLARACIEHDMTLVTVSSDYVFDGTATSHPEDEQYSPLGVYGQTKAAGELAASMAPKHYILRTSWVIGEGKNFVRTMSRLALAGASPSVVNDQVGVLTFADDLAGAILHILSEQPAYGVYNVTSGGDPTTWFRVAEEVFDVVAGRGDAVMGVSTATYLESSPPNRAVAPRPLHSVLPTHKLLSTGFEADTLTNLTDYLGAEGSNR